MPEYKLEANTSSEALAWLAEMDLVTNPAMLNNMILNLLVGVPGVKDANLVIDTQNKKMLIYLELGWFAIRFKAKVIDLHVNDIIKQVLPSWRLRVIFDRTILEKALALITSDKILK